MIYLFNNAKEMAIDIARRLVAYIQRCIEERDVCHMTFPGGRAPRPIFNVLSDATLDWSKLQLYPTDERCVPVCSEERNDRLIDELLIKTSILPEENLHRIPAELGVYEGARLYHEVLSNVPRFDLALLGIGCDGHTASLFPGDDWDEIKSALPVHNAPKLPSERVTISLSRLRDARERWVIVSGTEKKSVMERIQQGEVFPVTRVLPTVFFVDKKVMV